MASSRWAMVSDEKVLATSVRALALIADRCPESIKRIAAAMASAARSTTTRHRQRLSPSNGHVLTDYRGQTCRHPLERIDTEAFIL